MKRWIRLIGVLAMVGLVLAGCKSSTSTGPTTVVTLNFTTLSLSVGATQIFIATVSGPTDRTVKWQVNNIEGGNATIGTITTTGVYSAPTSVPVPNTVTVTAISIADPTASASASVVIDSGIRTTVSPTPVTIGTGELLNFHATVTGTFNTAVTWRVCQASNSSTTSTGPCTADTTSTLGTIDASGNYLAPLTVPSANPVSIEAVSVADGSQFGLASITLVSATDPVAVSIYPTHVAQGSLFVDAYLKGTNFVTTTVAIVNGVIVPSPAALNAGTLLRIRIPDTLMSPAPTVFQIQVKRQGGSPVNCAPDITLCRITVDAVRPAIVAAAPNSGLQNGPPVEFNINGGYFGTSASATTPTVTAEFDGSVRGATVTARQLRVTLSGADLSVPGLHQVTVRNPAVTLPAILPAQIARTNFAVQSCLGAAQGCAEPTVTLASLGVGSGPVAIAINTATGIAVVVNHNSNDVTLVDLNGAVPTIVPGGPIPVGAGPTGVAIDNVRNLAVVTNNTAKTISVINLATRAVTTVNTQITAAPFSVGINPITGFALIAYQSTNIGALVDLTQNPPAFVGAVTLGTGANPHVAVVPGLNWGLVTPGGAGTFSIVDLARRNSSSITASGAVRVSSTSTVTITTQTPHGLLTGDAVLITGVTDISFNGVFSVLAVPSSNSFTVTQAGPDATSGSGTAFYSQPLATVAFGVGVSGIAVNPEAGRAVMVDPTAGASVLTMSVLDQAVTPMLLESGTAAVAVNPYTDIAVTINPNTHQASVIDPRTPFRMTTVNLAGTNPSAVAIDPGSNQVLITNQGSNDLTVISLNTLANPIKPLHLESVNLPLNRQFGTDLTLASSTDLPLTLIGKGFVGMVARVDGFVLPAVGPVTDRVMNVVVPGTLLGAARRFSVDVVNPALASSVSNSEGFSVVKAVDLTSLACPSPVPTAVAVDDLRNLAFVTQSSCGRVAVVDVNTAAVTNNLAVGANPQGIATVPRLGLAVATNRGSNTASILNVADMSQAAISIAVGIEPIGVDISPIDGATLVTNSNTNSNSVTTFGAAEGPTATTTVTTVCGAPVAVAINPYDLQALVACATSTGGQNLVLLDISASPPVAVSQAAGPNQPAGVVFDPATKVYIVTSSLGNSVFFVNPATNQITPARDGINPFSIALNYLTNTAVTVNALSNTVSVLDTTDRRVRANMGLKGSLLGSVAIFSRTNLVIIVDQVNNRLLFVPLPN